MPTETRVSIKTSVPEYQKEAWVEHANALDMSQSEFLATMIQAGRRVFEEDGLEGPSPDANPRGNGLESHVLDTLSEDRYVGFEELLDSTADELDSLLQSLVQSGRVVMSNRKGGFRLVEDSHGHD
jgi:hypothetical protein